MYHVVVVLITNLQINIHISGVHVCKLFLSKCTQSKKLMKSLESTSLIHGIVGNSNLLSLRA